MNRSSAVVLAILFCAACVSVARGAGNPANGQATFETWCSGCHGAAKNNLSGVMNGANNPTTILSAWASYAPMWFLQSAFQNEQQTAEDVAAYLGAVAAGTKWLLQVPVALDLGSAMVGTQIPPMAIIVSSAGTSGVGITSVTSSNPAEFVVVSSTCTGTIAAATSCQITVAFKPSALGERGGAITILSNGAGNPQSVTLSGTGTSSVTTAVNYEGLWWASPPGSESGWGINFAHQGDVIFATWFTYDLTGKGWWLSMTANKTGKNVFAGTLYQTSGPAFDAVPFDPTQVVGTAVGMATLTFTDASDAIFAYTVNGISQIKAITREVFGPLPTCTFSAQNNLAAATNYQDLWWKTPAGSESGWGINLTQQGETIFATWFTYDHDHSAMWLTATANKTAPGTYSGDLYRTTGPAFNAVPFNPSAVIPTKVGSATFTFGDGNNGVFSYTVNQVSQSKAITREVFRAPGTVCK